MKIVSLDLHDLSAQNNNLFFLELLRQQYPTLKVSAFYVPADSQFPPMAPHMMEEAKRLIRNAVLEGWLELIPHGITHTFGEFRKVDEDTMKLAIDAYKEHFTDLGTPFVKGFCAPNWLLHEEAIAALDEAGWWLALDRNQPGAPKAKRNYTYTWDIADPFPTGEEVVMGHGHISAPSKNNLPECLKNLAKIPGDYEWKFVSELMKEGYDGRA